MTTFIELGDDDRDRLLARMHEREIHILTTDPADRPRAEAAIHRAYAQAGHPAPTRIIWCGSPLALAVGTSFSPYGGAVPVPAPGPVWRLGRTHENGMRYTPGRAMWGLEDPFRADLSRAIREARVDLVPDQLRIRLPLGEQVTARATKAIQGHLIGTAGVHALSEPPISPTPPQFFFSLPRADRLNRNALDGFTRCIATNVTEAYQSQISPAGDPTLTVNLLDGIRFAMRMVNLGQDTAWQTYVLGFLCEYLGLAEEQDALKPFLALAHTAGWWLPTAGICWVAERHTTARVDTQGRPHCEDGPAIAYPDGWSIYAIHGIQVPRDVVMAPETITIHDIFRESNLELRRVILGRFGIDRFIEETGAAPIDQDRDGHAERFLYRLTQMGRLTWLRVQNSTANPDGTREQYALQVPPETRTCAEAVAWSFGLTAGAYAPVVES